MTPIKLGTVHGVGLICPRCSSWTSLTHSTMTDARTVACMTCGHAMRVPDGAGKSRSQFLAMAADAGAPDWLMTAPAPNPIWPKAPAAI